VSLFPEPDDPRFAWQLDASCSGLDPELFFPTRGESTNEAREVCAGCPVREPCIEMGMAEKNGIWGGLSERERRALRRRRRQSA
jgi:WhiB family redox-sensing transcriptional regulator